MRIIAGEYRSRKLKTLEGDKTRPTLDKVKGAIFSKIGPKIYDAVFVDVFSGSGNLGLEAISRGASMVYFNDASTSACKIIKENIDILKVKNYSLTTLDYKSFLNKLESENIMADFIYLDPPFSDVDYHDLLNYVSNLQIIDKNTLIIVESKKELVLNENYNNLVLSKSVNYGSVKISYYSKEVD